MLCKVYANVMQKVVLLPPPPPRLPPRPPPAPAPRPPRPPPPRTRTLPSHRRRLYLWLRPQPSRKAGGKGPVEGPKGLMPIKRVCLNRSHSLQQPVPTRGPANRAKQNKKQNQTCYIRVRTQFSSVCTLDEMSVHVYNRFCTCIYIDKQITNLPNVYVHV